MIKTKSKYELFAELFLHRKDVVAIHNGGNWKPYYLDYNAKTMQPFNKNLFDQHISGIKRLGAYSTMPGDNECRWIVADFDENDAALEHCNKLQRKLIEFEINSFIERSNSGNGFHLWVFFKGPIKAALARRMMIGALTLADVPISGKMEKGSNTARSFDRLFPSQDTVQGGKFGNLVGLPLFGRAVEQGNTCFIDEQGQVVNQWALLQDIFNNHRIDPVHLIINKLAGFAPAQRNKPVAIANQDVSYKYWGAIANLPGQMERLTGCCAIQDSIQDADQFQEPQWADIVSNIAVYSLGEHEEEARKLAHTVSEGYSTYEEEATDTKFAYKKNNLQKEGWPTSCKTLMEHGGWTCPRFADKSCKYGFIAKYALPPSYLVYDTVYPLLIQDRILLHALEEQGVYEWFRKFVYTDKVKVNILDTNTNEYKWIPVELDDEKIAKHLLGIEEIQVRIVSRNWAKVKSIYLPSQPSVEKVLLEHRITYWKDSGKGIWVICSDEMERAASDRILLQKYGIETQRFDNVLLIHNEWREAPYFKGLSAIQDLLKELNANGHV